MGAVNRRTAWAVAALTVAAAFAIQHHQHRRKVRAMRAGQLAERIARTRAHTAYQAQLRAAADRLLADDMAVDEATAVIEGAWAQEQHDQQEGDGDDDG